MRITVDAKHWKVLPDLRELFAHRDLFLTLAIRDLKVRYAQTVLGLAWAVVQPLATLIIMSLIFGRAVEVETGNVPYPLFAIVGISAWSYFAFVLKESGGSRFVKDLRPTGTIVPPKWLYSCSACRQLYPRKRRIDLKKDVCGKCKGKLRLKSQIKNR